MTPPTLYAWFDASSRRHAGLAAVDCGDRTIGYDELRFLAERSARRMLRRTGTPPATVALHAAPGLDAYAAYLGALRLGACVVPLSPAHPARRTARILAAAAPDLVVTDTDGPGHGVPTLRLAAGPDREDGTPDLPPVPGEADALAYLLFTSGSTGAPKGVPIRNTHVGAHLAHTVHARGLGPGSRVSNTFDLTFDLSVYDLFVTWAAGATLVLPPPRAALLNPVRYVEEGGLTHWFSVPSLITLARRTRALRPGCMPTLRHSLFAGEQLTRPQAEAWAEAAPHSTLTNLYGPTEVTITCAAYELPADREAWPHTCNGTVPIGRVHAGLEHLVVDGDGAPADEGELLLRGPQRFAGYLDPADNHGRFTDLPDLPGDGTARAAGPQGVPGPDLWYRTGDRVRRDGDTLVHLGRLDHQVKVRGFRVELGEIEAVLRARPGVTEAVVVLAARSGGSLLAAYTGDSGLGPELAALAAESLPSYMCPESVVELDRMPLNANGKIDRLRLLDLLTSPQAPVPGLAVSR
ncbi:AMP-binding protein [Streptomyces sp. STR69]|uniref:AMP-binding protein n=1 Tax=Streptomyces sp. STR69 TaxID=1796942 RepID=UPI0021C8018C|nr:AMP-binding protein [Streptomyces sp. STR69]